MNPHSITRRAFLRGASAGLLGVGAGCAGVRRADDGRRFAPVRVSPDRVIRTVVGLRPFRASGFVVRAERLDGKTLVHHYGHGGAGITLSWGTAAFAVEAAMRAGPGPFAVLGCGVIGLSTARLLQRQGGEVVIYARVLPPETTSNVAGGFWYPTSVYDPGAVDAAFEERFRRACRISQRTFQPLVGDRYGVRWRESYVLRRAPGPSGELPGGPELYPEDRLHRDPRRYFGHPEVRQFDTLMIEPAVYLDALVRDFHTAGGRIVVRDFSDRRDVAALPEPVVVNCTGLGARALFGDEALVPVRGQLEILLPQPEVDYCYLAGPHYMFPREDGIVLGGTFDRGAWSLEADPAQRGAILEAHAAIARGMK